MTRKHARAAALRKSMDATEQGTRPLDTSHQGASNLLRDVRAWQPPRRSADSEILPELASLVGRSRDIDRNNGVAKGGIQTLVDNVVGTGLRLSLRPDYLGLGKDKAWAVEFARKYESLFCQWWWSTACHAGRKMTGDQMTAQVFRGAILNGDWVAIPLWLPDRGDGFATKIQTIESDRLSNPDGIGDSKDLRGGIELGPYGESIAGHIRKVHPGDFLVNGDALWGKWERIPFWTKFGRARLLHGYDPDRPEQTRGKPLLSAVLAQFKQIDRYTMAEIMAAVANAMIAGIIYTDLDQDAIVELFKGDSAAYLAARQDNAVALQSGTMLPLFPGDKVQPFIPNRPATQFGSFVENVYRIIAVALDMPYELLMKDFSKTNYSSARAAMLEAWRSFARRREWLGTQWMDPINLLFMEEMVHAGRIDAPDFYENKLLYAKARWIGPGRGWVDPVKEVDAAGKRIEYFLSTYEDEWAEQGKDWREGFEQRAYEQEEAKRLNLELPKPKTTPPPAPDSEADPTDGPANPKQPSPTQSGAA